MKTLGIAAAFLAVGSMLWFGKDRIYTITELADGNKQFDWGSRYHSRSGWDDRKWPRSTYEGISEAIRLLLEELGPAPSGCDVGSWMTGMSPCTNMFMFAPTAGDKPNAPAEARCKASPPSGCSDGGSNG